MDLTNHADLMFLDIAYSEDFSYSSTISYTSVNPTVINILPLLTTVNTKQECDLVGEAESSASPAS